MFGNKTSLGIDTDKKSNLVKATEKFLSVMYPSLKYPAELVSSLEKIIKHFQNNLDLFDSDKVSSTQSNEQNLFVFLRDFVYICLEKTPTSFKIGDFLNEDTVGELTKNFGLEVYIKLKIFLSVTPEKIRTQSMTSRLTKW